MNILVNSMPMEGLLTGICRYLRNMYAEMARLPETDISYFSAPPARRQMPELADSARWSRATAAIWKLPDPAIFALRSLHWLRYEGWLRRACRQESYDVYHETAFVPAAMSAVPTVYSVYDLSLIHYRDKHPRERVWFYDFFRKRRLRYASHILTISEFIRGEICDTFRLPPESVTAVPLAPDPLFVSQPVNQVQEVRQRLGLPEDYFLFVGSLEPRKNLPLLVKALERCQTKAGLALVGWEGWGDKRWLNTAQQSALSNQIVLTGYVDDVSLAALYSGALALVYPSLYEGFGLPILEAMSCGCPVICSNCASMPEVAGDAARLVDPFDADDLAAALDEMTAERVRDEWRAKGLTRAKEFSWARTAALTRNLFAQVATEARRSRRNLSEI